MNRMQIVKAVWNYRLSAQTARSAKVRAARGLAFLLALMLCFTLVSRATASMTVPVVVLEKPKRSVIAHTVSVQGVLQTADDMPVVAAAGVRVKELFVREGDTVAAGDLLFIYDIGEFQQQIAQKQIELTRLQAELAEIQDKTVLSQEKNELAQERAEEDKLATIQDADLNVQIAGEAMRQAREALRKYDGMWRDDFDDDDYTEAEYDSLRATYREKSIAYEQAQAAREKLIQDAQRTIDDLTQPQIDISEDTKQMDIQLKQLELSALYEAVQSQGQVFAPTGGLVTKLNIAVGSATQEQAAIHINHAQYLHFVATVGEEQKPYINQGNALTLKLGGGEQALEGVTVSSIKPSTEVAGAYQLVAEVPAGEWAPGTSGTAEVRQKSAMFDTCVPLAALRGFENEYYLLGIREVATSLGTEYIAETISVNLLEKNESLAAVSGGVTPDSRLIVSASRSVGEGDKVRFDGSAP